MVEEEIGIEQHYAQQLKSQGKVDYVSQHPVRIHPVGERELCVKHLRFCTAEMSSEAKHDV